LCWPERDIFKTARQRLASTVKNQVKRIASLEPKGGICSFRSSLRSTILPNSLPWSDLKTSQETKGIARTDKEKDTRFLTKAKTLSGACL